jgi:hypothetical protein
VDELGIGLNSFVIVNVTQRGFSRRMKQPHAGCL